MSGVDRLLRAALAALVLVTASNAAAQLQEVEAEGAVPVPAEAWTASTLRTQAQEAALREAVIQVATTLAAPAPAPAPAPEASGAAPLPPASDAPLPSPVAERVRAAFEDVRPLDFTERYRLVQDVGVRPRQLLADPAVTQEYVVRVEAHVDAARVRRTLATAGLLPAAPKPAAASAPSSFTVVVEGLPSPGAYEAVRRAIAERSKAKQVLPTTFSAREVAFAVRAGEVGPDPGEVLRGPVGSALWLEPVTGEAAGGPVRLRVTEPPPLTAEGEVGSAVESAERPPAPAGDEPVRAPEAAPPSAGSAPPSADRPSAPPGSVPPSAGPSSRAPDVLPRAAPTPSRD